MFDVAVIGGGIVGLAAARALLSEARCDLVVLEAEARLAAHQTGHNSGVIHSGLYYRPGSLKATHCAKGRKALYRFCRERGVAHEPCGKVIVATSDAEVARLAELARRGESNGLVGLERLDPAGLRRREPHVVGQAGLWVPQTGIVDFSDVAAALAAEIRERGGEVRTGARVMGVERPSSGFTLRLTDGRIGARALVNCAGLQADRLARMCGVRPDVRIIPLRGEYHRLRPGRENLVRNLIYPVPDPRFPFLGVHFTRRIRGGVDVGPNAILALRREGYARTSFSARDALAIFSYPGFWRMAARHWRTGAREIRRSLDSAALVGDLRRMVPDLTRGDLIPAGAGVRAQAVTRDGSLVDDFRIVTAPGMLHVLNAPSPAATAALSIASSLSKMGHSSFSGRPLTSFP